MTVYAFPSLQIKKKLQWIKKIIGRGRTQADVIEKNTSVSISSYFSLLNLLTVLAMQQFWHMARSGTPWMRLFWLGHFGHGKRHTHVNKNTDSNTPGPRDRGPTLHTPDGDQLQFPPTNSRHRHGTRHLLHGQRHPSVLCYKDGDLRIL